MKNAFYWNVNIGIGFPFFFFIPSMQGLQKMEPFSLLVYWLQRYLIIKGESWGEFITIAGVESKTNLDKWAVVVVVTLSSMSNQVLFVTYLSTANVAANQKSSFVNKYRPNIFIIIGYDLASAS